MQAHTIINSETIAQQIAEFQARGGKIQPISIGISASTDCKLAASNTTEKPNAPASTKNCTLPKNTDEINLTAAAKLLGMSIGVVGRWANKGKLQILRTSTGRVREKFVSRAALEKLKSEMQKKENPIEQEFVNLKQAAHLIGIHESTLTHRIAVGTIRIEQQDNNGSRHKKFKTSDVINYINKQTEI